MNVDKTIVMPVSANGRKKYPFAEMAVGDSVFFDGAKTGGREYVAAQLYARYHGWKFTGRTIDGGLRIWRVE